MPFELQQAIVVPHHPVIGHGPRLLEPKHRLEVRAARRRHMEVIRRPRLLSEALVVIGPVRRIEQRIGAREVGDPEPAQFFH